MWRLSERRESAELDADSCAACIITRMFNSSLNARPILALWELQLWSSKVTPRSRLAFGALSSAAQGSHLSHAYLSLIGFYTLIFCSEFAVFFACVRAVDYWDPASTHWKISSISSSYWWRQNYTLTAQKDLLKHQLRWVYSVNPKPLPASGISMP